MWLKGWGLFTVPQKSQQQNNNDDDNDADADVDAAWSLGRLVAWSLGHSIARSLDRSVARSLGRSLGPSLACLIARSVSCMYNNYSICEKGCVRVYVLVRFSVRLPFYNPLVASQLLSSGQKRSLVINRPLEQNFYNSNQ